MAGSYSDNGSSITVRYDTGGEALDDVEHHKRLLRVGVHGSPNAAVSVYASASEYPEQTPTHTLLGTATLNSTGYGALDCDLWGKWFDFYFTEMSSNAFELKEYDLMYAVRSKR
jgi:hypothetical protein